MNLFSLWYYWYYSSNTIPQSTTYIRLRFFASPTPPFSPLFARVLRVLLRCLRTRPRSRSGTKVPEVVFCIFLYCAQFVVLILGWALFLDCSLQLFAHFLPHRQGVRTKKNPYCPRTEEGVNNRTRCTSWYGLAYIYRCYY